MLGRKRMFIPGLNAAPHRMRVAFILVVTGGYALTFLPLYRWLGPNMAVLGGLPVIVAGWLLGTRAGLLMTLSIFVINTLLYRLAGHNDWSLAIKGGNGLGFAITLIVSLVVGQLHDLSEKLRGEISERELIEKALRSAQGELETRVQEQTARLMDANRALKAEIEQRTRTQNEVQRLRAFNEGIVQNLAGGILVADAPGNMVFLNPAAEALLGYTVEELVGQHWTTIIPPDQRLIVQAAEERRRRGEADRYEVQMARQDGMRLSVLISGSPFFEGDHFGGSVAVFTDITQRTLAEEALKTAKHTLEKRNARLETLYRVGQMVNSTLESDTILDRLTDEAMRVTRASHGQVLVVREQVGRFERRSQRGFSPEEKERSDADHLFLDKGINGQSYVTQKIICIDDVQEEPDYFSLIPTTRSELAVPIIRDGKVLGNLDLQSPEVGGFRDVDLDYLNALTDQVAIALENARLFSAARRQAEQLEALRQVSQGLMVLRDLDTQLHQIAERAIGLLNAQSGGIYLYCPRREVIEWAVVVGEIATSEQTPVGSILQRGEGLSGKVWETGEPLIIDDYETWIRKPLKWSQPELALLGVPIQWGDEFLGVLLTGTNNKNHKFTAEDATLLSQFATQAAIAIKNASLYQETARRAEEMASLYEIGLATVSSLSLDDVLTAIYKQCRAVLPCDNFYVALHQPGERYITFPMFMDRGQAVDVKPLDFEAGEGFTSFIIRQRQPLLINSKSTSGQDPPVQPMIAAPNPPDTFLGVPMILRDEGIGVLAVQSSDIKAYNDDHVRLLTTIAAQAAIAIGNAQLYEAVQQELAERERAEQELLRRTLQLESLRQVGLELTAQLDPDALLRFIVSQAIEMLQGSGGGISLIQTDQDTHVWATSAAVNMNPRNKAPGRGEGVVGKVWETGEPIIVSDYWGWEGRMPDLAREDMVFSSIVGVPVRQGDDFLGVLVIVSERPAAFAPVDAEMLNLFATQAAIAIGNARLYEQAQQEIVERTRIEADLKKYAAELEKSNRELEDFVYVAYHDLQEPLRKVQAFGDRLQIKYAEILDQRGRDYLTRMQNAAGRMQALINDLLIYSQVTTRGRSFVPVDLTQVAQEVVSDLYARIEENGGRVKIGELPTIDADPAQMRQLMWNLIDNALKFRRTDQALFVQVCANFSRTQGKSPLDTLAGDETDSGDEQCQIFIKDNGIGFDEKYLARIFQVFQRLHSRDKYKGTGMGLATCRKIAERHGGNITAQSTLGQGSTFVVTLPVKQFSGENEP